MRILALDLGVSTGWASLYRYKDKTASTVASGTIPYSEFTFQLPALLRSWEFSHIVMELPLLISRGQLRDQLDNVVAWTFTAIGTTPRTEVYASEWKGTKYAKMKMSRGLTSHERDAIRMGHWFSEQRLQGS
jgi:hypothetical protein